jgi:hypothetical protein
MSRTVVTPVGRFSYCNLFEPKIETRKNKKTGKTSEVELYSLSLILEPDADLTDLKALVQEAKAEYIKKKGDPGYMRSPFRRGVQKSDEYPLGYDLAKNPEYEGKIIISATSQKIRPDVRDANVQPILDPSQVYSGCYGRMSVVAFAYDGESKGITFGLQNVQKVRDGEPLGVKRSKAEDDFTAFEQPAAAGFHDDLLDL